MNIKDPQIIDQLLSPEVYGELLDSVKNIKDFEYDPGFCRYLASDDRLAILRKISEDLIPMVRTMFSSNGLLPTYSLFSHYEGKDNLPSLSKHRDDNACTYTIDMCVYQTIPWNLWVNDEPYVLHKNQALAYYGNDQLHWRDEFPGSIDDNVAMIFFHFAEPDHWWFTRGRSYLQVVRGLITEEQWELENGKG